MSKTVIRERVGRDLEGCVYALYEVHRSDGYPVVWPEDPIRWLTPRGLVRAWVAHLPDSAPDGGIVGHVLLRECSDPERYELSRLFVTPSGRGEGLGGALIEQARVWAAGEGRELILDVVADERSHAIALYEKTGWRKVSTFSADWTAPDGSPVTVHRYVL